MSYLFEIVDVIPMQAIYIYSFIRNSRALL